MSDISNVILFNGTLEELNSIDPSTQYKLAGTEFISKEYSVSLLKRGMVQQELLDNGYDGLIHKSTIPWDKVLFIYPTFRVEGTPIVRK